MLRFMSKFPNFRCHGNRGWFDTNFTYTVTSADLKTPIWWKNLGDISNTTMADFVSQWHQLVAMATRVGLTEIWLILCGSSWLLSVFYWQHYVRAGTVLICHLQLNRRRRDTRTRNWYQKLVQVVWYQKRARVSVNLVPVFMVQVFVTE